MDLVLCVIFSIDFLLYTNITTIVMMLKRKIWRHALSLFYILQRE